MKFIWSLIFPAILIGSTEGTANEIANDFINAVGNGGNTGQRMHRKGMTMMKGGGSKKKKQISNKKIGGGLRANKQKLNGLPSFMLPESSPDQTVATEQDIIDGSWLLFNLEFEDEIHTDGGSDYKGQVYGLFCKIDLSTQKKDPSKGKSGASRTPARLPDIFSVSLTTQVPSFPWQSSSIFYELYSRRKMQAARKSCQARFI